MGRPPRAATSRRRIRSLEAVLVLGMLAAAAVLTAVTWPGSSKSQVLPQAAAAVVGGTQTGAQSRAQSGAQSGAQSTVVDDSPDGEEIFLRDCAWCHGETAEGSQLAPSLEESGAAGAHFQLTTGRMPLQSAEDEPEPGPPAYPPETIEAIVDHVRSITTGPDVPDVAPGDVARGRTLFLYNCAPCHSSSGTGMILPGGAFASELLDTTPTQVVEAMRLGPGPMPSFPDTQLDKEQADAIATYVQQLGEQQDIGGQPLDWIGPIYEGAVAWLLGIPVLVLVIRLLGKRAP
ncbi:MAG TPA: c-type cytochrome [Nocardioidaceae bacterium]|nr:c-type cytochrome [Nocardioidaceae bacterium]